jgi:hypothetical protein
MNPGQPPFMAAESAFNTSGLPRSIKVYSFMIIIGAGPAFVLRFRGGREKSGELRFLQLAPISWSCHEGNRSIHWFSMEWFNTILSFGMTLSTSADDVTDRGFIPWKSPSSANRKSRPGGDTGPNPDQTALTARRGLAMVPVHLEDSTSRWPYFKKPAQIDGSRGLVPRSRSGPDPVRPHPDPFPIPGGSGGQFPPRHRE